MGRKKQFDAPLCHPEAPYFAKDKCRPCYNRIDKRSRKRVLQNTNRQEYRIWNFNNKNRAAEKLTLQDYEFLYEASHGTCYICGYIGKLVIDHNHTTGKIRGLLCNHCNWGLGHFKDNQELLDNAIQYLSNPRPLSDGGEK